MSPKAQRAYRLARRYGLTPEQYDAIKAGQHGACALCRAEAKLGAHRTGRTIHGFVCWGCRAALRLYARFPAQRALLGLAARDRVEKLLGPAPPAPHEHGAERSARVSLPVRESSESVKVRTDQALAVKGALAQADLIEAQRRLAQNPADQAALRVLAGLRDEPT